MSEAHAAQHPALKSHFDDLEQQFEASAFGMWLFLATEILFFGGLFTAYLIYRLQYPEAFAGASHQLNVLLGGINTAVLISSSLTMAMGVWGAQMGRRRTQIVFLLLTIALGFVFLGIKSVEYAHKFQEGLVPGAAFRYEGPDPVHAQLFFSLYFVMTGLHALHMIIGIGIMAVLTVMAARGRFTRTYHTPVDVSGLYWHFVDIVWIFLFPLLYLVHPH
jgi:cytochrome c oxidase subunit 3